MDEAKTKKGDLRAQAIQIMIDNGSGSSFEMNVDMIAEKNWGPLRTDEARKKAKDKAKGYYRYIEAMKLCGVDYQYMKPVRASSTTKPKTPEGDGGTELKSKSTTETQSTEPASTNKLTKIKRINKKDPASATQAIEAMAQAGAHHAMAA